MRLGWVGPLILCTEEILRVPRGLCGVYILHGYDGGRGWYPPLYVGKAICLTRRLLQHLRSRSTAAELPGIRLRLRLFFSAAPITDERYLDAIEAGLVCLLRPPLNRQVPRAVRVYSNLPPMILGRENT